MEIRGLPLRDIVVLDLTRARSGPTAVRQFADWGADVLKIEMPDEAEAGDGMGGARGGSDFQNLHRNKRSMTLNLRDQEGQEIFLKLAARADVVVESTTRRSGRSIPASFTVASPASARADRIGIAQAMTRSLRAWAG